MRTPWWLLLVPACTPSSPIARLADLPDPQFAGTQDGFNLRYDTSVDCFTLSSDVHGTVDGQPLAFSAGGWRDAGEDGNICDGISVVFPSALANTTATSIELADGETTWSFGVEMLAPSAWTITPPLDAVEGSDVTVSFAPNPPGVVLSEIFIEPDGVGIEPFVAIPNSADTVHIDAGYWSAQDQATPGETLPATVLVQLAPLTVDGCPVASCSFETETPDPAPPITIVIP
ncbi:MAG TPA: hypothetical protein VGG28_31885 [Kofleriaceae bacterium]|jgi:hypothetical protein